MEMETEISLLANKVKLLLEELYLMETMPLGKITANFHDSIYIRSRVIQEEIEAIQDSIYRNKITYLERDLGNV